MLLFYSGRLTAHAGTETSFISMQCSGSDLVDKTFTQLDSRPDGCKKLGLITAGCTSTSLVSSYVGNHFNVPEVWKLFTILLYACPCM